RSRHRQGRVHVRAAGAGAVARTRSRGTRRGMKDFERDEYRSVSMVGTEPAGADAASRANPERAVATGIAGRCRRLADGATFQGGILAVIVVNAVVLGLETSPALVARYGAWFDAVNVIAQAIFTVEIAI